MEEKSMKYVFAAIIASGLAAGCAAPSLDVAAAEALMPGAAAPSAVAPVAFDYASMFGQDDRPATDYEQYEVRKSAQILAFTRVAPGMTVVDLEAGGGVYTELFSRVVGDAGKVYMQNPAAFDAFLGDAVSTRVDGRLSNVVKLKSNFDDLSAVPDGTADRVTWLLGPHELWYTPDGAEPGALGDPDATFAEIARVTRPGGHFIVLDHMAPVGAPATTGGDTHRIDKAIVISLAEANGFRLAEESDLFANAEDDRTINVFDPSIRRKTDRFLLRFEKNQAPDL
ncbi:MAG: putative methyltransferase [Hyphomonas sp.]